ncbi:hypothetical protein [Pseudomonas rubra]|uniref:Uncharacterized protein n=1 Tax=Pseudomonas rubra TaxID=2942627 RepID=A0ABT5PFH8_9PSED|nr:hypothetical protein [Pseudomonas rubra]MDD1016956.1 hypothetical protein [Pseudomonas rubra]MDD1041047.1 hypothetical protein [Pseudomonas rubra]MDD1157474.1 hypothetical protein [Pseudomonas rubra]
MHFRKLIFTLAALPAIALADVHIFDGNYSVAVGPGPLKELYVLSVTGVGGTMTLAKPFQKPLPARAVNIEQLPKRMTVTSDEDKQLKLVFEKTEKGLACIEGCNAYSRNWEDIQLAKEMRDQQVNPASKVDFDALPTTDLGSIDGAWIQSKTDPADTNDTAYEIKGEFVKRYYFLFGLYPKSSTPDVLLISGNYFKYPKSGDKGIQVKKISDTKLIARFPQSKDLVFLYKANSINFTDLKKALVEADPRT